MVDGTGRDGGVGQGGAVRGSGVRIMNSIFTNNFAVGGNGGISTIPHLSGIGRSGTGGAIYDGDPRIANITVVENVASGGTGRIGGDGLGGGIYFQGDGGQWKLSNSTITNNVASAGTGTQTNGLSQGGGVFTVLEENPFRDFRNNVVAENAASVGTDLFGSYLNGRNNLVRIGEGSTGLTNGSNGNQVGTAASPVDPVLAPLADNGGITMTRALLLGSPAIDAGNNTVFNPVVTPLDSQPLLHDQRNFQRRFPATGNIDIGAYEFGSPETPLASSAPDLRATSDTGASSTDNVTTSTSPIFDIGNTIPGGTLELLRDNVSVATTVPIGFAVSLTDPLPPLDALVQYTVRQTIGTASSVSNPLSVTFDHTAPTGTFNQAATQADPTRLLPINFTGSFSERVNIGPISYQGSTANMTFAQANFSTSDGGVTWNVAVSSISNSNGLVVVASLPAGAVVDLAGNVGGGATSVDNSVTLDNVRPAVTINQAPAQPDPAFGQPLRFVANFSEPVTGFTQSDISLSGSSANTAQAQIVVSGGPALYEVSVNNIISSGSVRVTIPANGAQDALGNLSFASTSTDNTVTFTLRTSTFDYDGDRRTDFSVFRPNGGAWYLQRSTAGFQGLQFGADGDKLTPADYDGDGKTDIAVYRPSTGTWFVLKSSTGTVDYPVFGAAEDVPAPGDFDGDGKADLVVFRPSQGIWYRVNSSDGSFFAFPFGQSGDVPTVGDFDGDGKNDYGIFRPSIGDWYNVRSSDGGLFGERFGQSGDRIAPADYDGDGKTDIAIFRPSTGLWVLRNSATAAYSYHVFGAPSDIPISGDYDGDGKADIGVWRPSDGTWYIQRSDNGQFIVFPWGQDGDNPTPSAYGN